MAKKPTVEELHEDILGLQDQIIGLQQQILFAQKIQGRLIDVLADVTRLVRDHQHEPCFPFPSLSIDQEVRTYLSELTGKLWR